MLKKRLIIDFSHLCYRTLHANHGTDWNKEGFAFHRHLVLNSILASMRKFGPDEVILAIDDRRNWRKKIYSGYKKSRKVKRAASDINFEAYFEYIPGYIESLKELPFKIISVPFCEADDVVGVLSKYLIDSENIIVTSDRDYIQVLKHPHNKIFDPLKRKFMDEPNPSKSLKIKILMGDKSDDIPAIKERVGPKTALKLIDTGEIDTLLETDELVKQNYIRNEKLISFDMIPDILQRKIIEVYDEYKLSEVPVNYFDWFVKFGLRQISENSSNNTNMLKKLSPATNKEYKGALIDLF